MFRNIVYLLYEILFINLIQAKAKSIKIIYNYLLNLYFLHSIVETRYVGRSNMNSNINNNLAIYYCGHEKCSFNHSFGPAVRNQYLLHYIIDGQGIYRVNEQEYKVNKGEVFLIRPKELTFYQADEKTPWEYMWVAFDGLHSGEIVEKIGMKNVYCRMIPNTNKFQKYLTHIIDRFAKNQVEDFLMLSYFYGAMAQLEEDVENISYNESYLIRAIRYMKQNYSYPIKIQDVANYIGIDRTYLYRIFIENEEISPKQYLINIRISVAKNMLLVGKYSVNEIALSCGFCDAPLFINHFKKNTGKTPKEFKREYKGGNFLSEEEKI